MNSPRHIAPTSSPAIKIKFALPESEEGDQKRTEETSGGKSSPDFDNNS